MNRLMWAHAATQANVAVAALARRARSSARCGEQACGEIGREAACSSPVRSCLARAGRRMSASTALAGRRVVVSAGPTFEDIDPVRFIGNRSSGKMGFAIAAAAVRAARRWCWSPARSHWQRRMACSA
jgi:phosphopantothenoylcysteine decarboxylase/phosphopantothenate--cysteine ligase